MNSELGHEIRLAAPPPPSSQDVSDNPVLEEAQAAIGQFADEDGAALPQVVADLIKRCLDGTEPIEGLGSDKYWVATKFSARHVNIVMLRVAGFKNIEIAQAMGTTPVTVCSIVNHPYGRKIINAMLAARGTRVLDIRTKLDYYADEILDHIYDLTAKSADLDVVSKVGFGLLDRAGYSVTHKVAHQAPLAASASESTLSRLASALEESGSIEAHILPVYVPKGPPEDQGRATAAGFAGQSQGSPPEPLGELGTSGGLRLAKVSGA